MSYNIMNPLFPRPAVKASTTAFITSHVVTVTAAAATDTSAFNTTSPGAVDLVYFDVHGGDVRTFWEGSTPTSTSGHVLQAGTAYTWAAVRYNNAKFILDATASTGVIVASPLTAG